MWKGSDLHCLRHKVLGFWIIGAEGVILKRISKSGIPHKVRATFNALERFIKEVKRRSKVIEVFPDAQATSKVLYLVSLEMNERYRLKGFKRLFHG